MKRKLALVLAAVVVAASSVMGGTVSARAEVDVYTTPGVHHVNGRDWRTTCEPYSQTMRCRTEIKATQVSQVGGRFVTVTGWAFNNLTYLPSSRSLWKNNPLGYKGSWTASDGRKWTTDCDSPATGRNGCRSYAQAKVVERYNVGGQWNYRWVTTMLFNNIVQFAAPGSTINVPDTVLRKCINEERGWPAEAAITKAQAAKVRTLDCGTRGISNLTGLEHFSNLDDLNLEQNSITSLTPLKGLRKLGMLNLWENRIVDVSPLAGIRSLGWLELTDNYIVDVAPLAQLTDLGFLNLENNKIIKVAPLATLPNLSMLGLFENPITDIGTLAPLKARGCIVYTDGPAGS